MQNLVMASVKGKIRSRDHALGDRELHEWLRDFHAVTKEDVARLTLGGQQSSEVAPTFRGRHETKGRRPAAN